MCSRFHCPNKHMFTLYIYDIQLAYPQNEKNNGQWWGKTNTYIIIYIYMFPLESSQKPTSFASQRVIFRIHLVMAICYVTSSVGELLLHTLKVRVWSEELGDLTGTWEKPWWIGGKNMRKWMNIWGIYGINGPPWKITCLWVGWSGFKSSVGTLGFWSSRKMGIWASSFRGTSKIQGDLNLQR